MGAAAAPDPLSQVFAALADPVRRDLVVQLTDGDATVTDLAAPFDISLQAVSRHLQVLGEAGLVSRRREGRQRPVHLEAEVFDLATKWLERHRRRAEERFARLDDVLAAMADTDDGAAAPTTDTDDTNDTTDTDDGAPVKTSDTPLDESTDSSTT